MTKTRVRFAPSPTGFLHVGGLRTALFNYLFAKNQKGTFIVRLEDTDKARTVPGAAENIAQTLAEIGIGPDEGVVWKDGLTEVGNLGPYTQSKRLDLYKAHTQELIESGHAYYCFCTPQRLEELRKQQEANHQPPKYDKFCLKQPKDEIKKKLDANEAHVVRLNVPADKEIRFTDLVHGEIKISTNEIDDQVLLKSDGFPTYHLANVVDDHLMQISLVIRGEEWIPSTPKHILLYSAFGWESPQFAHLPLLLSKSKKKLSKRDGDVAVKDFVAQGYLPEALLNFVALLGWNPKTEQEIFSLKELVEQFSFSKVNKAGAVFDLEKLDWINGSYIRKLSIEELFTRIKQYLPDELKSMPHEFVYKVLELEKERLKKLSEIGERVGYFIKEPAYDSALLLFKKASAETTKLNLEKLLAYVKDFNEKDFTKNISEEKIKSFIAENNLKTGEVLWPLRVALSGLEASPGPFEIMDAFSVLSDGKKIILSRIEAAISKL